MGGWRVEPACCWPGVVDDGMMSDADDGIVDRRYYC